MSVAGEGDSSLSSLSSSSFVSSTLRFFVMTPFKTIALYIRSDETIQSIISRVAAPTRIPSNCLHLHYGDRQLPSDWTLSCCGIENDANLQLIYSLEVTRFCLPWKVVNDFKVLIENLLSIPSHTSSIQEMLIYNNIEILIRKFVLMTPTLNDIDTMCHLEVFFYSSAHTAIGKLYQSPLTFQQKVVDYVVRLFLKYLFIKLPTPNHIHIVPVLLAFCKLFIEAKGKRDALYIYCQRTLGLMLDSKSWKVFMIPKWVNFALEFYPFVVEFAEQIILSLSSESMSLSLTDVAQFSCFLKALRREIKEYKRTHFIPKEILLVKCTTCLYEIFIKILKQLDESLQKIENFMAQNADMEVESQLRQWTHILIVIFHCSKLGEIYEDGSELLHGLLLYRRVPLNALIRSASRNDKYHWFLKHKDVTDFETRKILVMMLFPESCNGFLEPLEMLIDRSQLFAESFIYIGPVDAFRLHSGLFVEFENEEATGYGVLREWLCLLCQAIFSPQNALFLPCPNDRRRFFPNPASSSSIQLQFFSFAGRVIALALMHKVQVGITFDRVFFMQLAGQTVTLEDIQSADPFLHMSCKKILEMDEETLDSDVLGLTFERETKDRRTIEICPGGKEIAVDSRNREHFVELLVHNCFVEAIREQIKHFGLGFSDMLSKAKFGRLLFQGLELVDFDRMLGGSEDTIDVEDWKAHTEYRGYGAEDQQISWFWEVVEGMDEKQKKTLLCFWTSLRYLPVEGFSGLESKLLISMASASENFLPSSQTCFYMLLLPPYPYFSAMNSKLQLITRDHMSCTFGFC